MTAVISDPMTDAEAEAIVASVFDFPQVRGDHASALTFAHRVAEAARLAFAQGIATTDAYGVSALIVFLSRNVRPFGIDASAASHIRVTIVSAIVAQQPPRPRSEPFEDGRIVGHISEESSRDDLASFYNDAA